MRKKVCFPASDNLNTSKNAAFLLKDAATRKLYAKRVRENGVAVL